MKRKEASSAPYKRVQLDAFARHSLANQGSSRGLPRHSLGKPRKQSGITPVEVRVLMDGPCEVVVSPVLQGKDSAETRWDMAAKLPIEREVLTAGSCSTWFGSAT